MASAAELRVKEKAALVQAALSHFKTALGTEVLNARLKRPATDLAALKDNEDFRKLADEWLKKYSREVLPPPRTDK